MAGERAVPTAKTETQRLLDDALTELWFRMPHDGYGAHPETGKVADGVFRLSKPIAIQAVHDKFESDILPVTPERARLLSNYERGRRSRVAAELAQLPQTVEKDPSVRCSEVIEFRTDKDWFPSRYIACSGSNTPERKIEPHYEYNTPCVETEEVDRLVKLAMGDTRGYASENRLWEVGARVMGPLLSMEEEKTYGATANVSYGIFTPAAGIRKILQIRLGGAVGYANTSSRSVMDIVEGDDSPQRARRSEGVLLTSNLELRAHWGSPAFLASDIGAGYMIPTEGKGYAVCNVNFGFGFEITSRLKILALAMYEMDMGGFGLGLNLGPTYSF